jgi:hypothetical protein
MNNQRYATTEREQTRLKVTLFVNAFSIFRLALPAHNGLVAGSSPAGPTNEISDLSILIFSTPSEIPTRSATISAQISKSSQWRLRQAGRALRSACRLLASGEDGRAAREPRLGKPPCYHRRERQPQGRRGARSNQNIENNPMQSSRMAVAGTDALSDPAKNILTRRANQRHYSIIT